MWVKMMVAVDPKKIWSADTTSSAPDNISFHLIPGELEPLPYIIQPLLLSQREGNLCLNGPYMGAAEINEDNMYAQLKRISTKGDLRIVSMPIPDMSEPKDEKWLVGLRVYAVSAENRIVEPGGIYQKVLPLAFTRNDYYKRAIYLSDVALNVKPPDQEGMFEGSGKQPAQGYMQRSCNAWIDLSDSNPVIFTLDPNIALGVVSYLENHMPLVEKAKLGLRRAKTKII